MRKILSKLLRAKSFGILSRLSLCPLPCIGPSLLTSSPFIHIFHFLLYSNCYFKCAPNLCRIRFSRKFLPLTKCPYPSSPPTVTLFPHNNTKQIFRPTSLEPGHHSALLQPPSQFPSLSWRTTSSGCVRLLLRPTGKLPCRFSVRVHRPNRKSGPRLQRTPKCSSPSQTAPGEAVSTTASISAVLGKRVRRGTGRSRGRRRRTGSS